MKNAAKRVFACKDRCRYSRKRAKFWLESATVTLPTDYEPFGPTVSIEVRCQRVYPAWFSVQVTRVLRSGNALAYHRTARIPRGNGLGRIQGDTFPPPTGEIGNFTMSSQTVSASEHFGLRAVSGKGRWILGGGGEKAMWRART